MEKPKILIVEDERKTIDMIRRNVERIIDCSIDESNDGQDAINKIKTNKYDLAILDIKMPGLSGIDVLKETREDANFPDTIVITAYDSIQVASEAVTQGAVDYIPKPIDLETLKIKIKAILERKGKFIEKR